MDPMDPQQIPAETASWVHDLLRQVPGEPLPGAVRQRVLDALQAEQVLRESSDFNPDADVEDLVNPDEPAQPLRAFSRTGSSATDAS